MFYENCNSCHNEILILVLKNQRSLRSFYRLFLFFSLLIKPVEIEWKNVKFNFKLWVSSMIISASLSSNSSISIMLSFLAHFKLYVRCFYLQKIIQISHFKMLTMSGKIQAYKNKTRIRIWIEQLLEYIGQELKFF